REHANSSVAAYETRKIRYERPRKRHQGRPSRQGDRARQLLETLVERGVRDGDFIAKVRDMHVNAGSFSTATWQRELRRAALLIRDNESPTTRGKLRERPHRFTSPPGLTMRRLYV